MEAGRVWEDGVFIVAEEDDGQQVPQPYDSLNHVATPSTQVIITSSMIGHKAAVRAKFRDHVMVHAQLTFPSYHSCSTVVTWAWTENGQSDRESKVLVKGDWGLKVRPSSKTILIGALRNDRWKFKESWFILQPHILLIWGWINTMKKKAFQKFFVAESRWLLQNRIQWGYTFRAFIEHKNKLEEE
jgi:hypothetical protein